MSLACSLPAEGMNALNYTEKNSINEAEKKKKKPWEFSQDSWENNKYLKIMREKIRNKESKQI